MKNNIIEIKKEIIPILKDCDVKRATVFGSFARGDQNKKSDVDILIRFKNDDKSLFDLIGLKFDLEEVLKRKVDVLTYNSLHPLFLKI